MTRSTLIALLDAEPRVRLAALERASDDPTSRHALRNAMLCDGDGRVRARAAAKLGRKGEPSFAGALLEAARTDPMPLVREAAWRALACKKASVKSRQVIDAAAHAATADPVWWVRTAATTALIAIGGENAVSELCAALGDPFWRVRNTAANGLLRLGRCSTSVRQQVLATPQQSATEIAAVEYLRRRWHGEPAELLEPSAEPAPADPLWDADPAVTTARLEHPGAAPSAALLIELLADPHESLRKRAAELLGRTKDVRALRAALGWLAEPRIPHAAQTVSALLGRCPEEASELVAEIFAEVEAREAGVVVWAIGWVGATCSATHGAAVRECLDHEDRDVREAAIECLWQLGLTETASDRLLELARDVEPVQHSAVRALCASVAEVAAKLLEAPPDSVGPLARRELTRLAIARDHFGWLRAAARDSDVVCRAMALGFLASSLGPDEIALARRDSDPWIRSAVITESSAAQVLRDDGDPGVRRAAMRVLALSFDREPMVRAAAIDALPRATSADVAMLAGDPAAEIAVRKAAYTWLLRAFDEDAAIALAAAYEATSDAELAAHLAAMRIAMPDHEALAKVPLPSRRAARPAAATAPPAEIEHRRLGSTDLWVSPLALSGANDLPESALQRGFEAGVNLYFWEPQYLRLGRFLRRPSIAQHARVVAGSYHGSAERIEADVQTALRRLRRERIDLFLIFWVRSAERLSREIFDCLARLKEAGKIGAAGFSTHHRQLAARAITEQPWDAIMVRHSAAHTGAEDALLPLAAEREVGVLTFTALCYGRLLQPSPEHPGASAADCYRYSLGQPGVTAVISAPARRRELAHNLDVLDSPGLDPATIDSLRAHGRWVYSQSKDFNALIRRTPQRMPGALSVATLEENLIEEP